MVDQSDRMDGEAVVEIVESQMAENPPRVKETLMRLMLLCRRYHRYLHTGRSDLS